MVAKSDCSSGAQSTSQHDAENSRHRAATLLGRDGRDGRPPNCRRIASRRRALGPTLSPSSLRSSSVRSCRSGSRTSSAARVGKRSPSALACRNLARPSALESGGGSACAITGVRGDAPKKVGTAASAPATPVGCAACRRIGPSCFSRSAAYEQRTRPGSGVRARRGVRERIRRRPRTRAARGRTAAARPMAPSTIVRGVGSERMGA